MFECECVFLNFCLYARVLSFVSLCACVRVCIVCVFICVRSCVYK